ncbi:MAG: hypothetical protein QOE79_1672 [Sphingomonadales bacterium]|nr:hypothetical protein [Sphingomonadales bacterium]MEA3050066.1 hypothetical protein [Sphingomonadales bacterium]
MKRLALNLAFGLAAAACAAPASAATESCTLHVTGAKPRPFKPNFMIKVKGPIANPDDPTTSAYQYNPVTRALALSDAELRTLFPAGVDVTIVREAQGITKDALTKAKGPIFASPGACHAELFVSDVVGVIPPGPSNPYGLVGMLLAGRARLELIFTYRRFDAGKERPLIVSDRESGRITEGAMTASGATLADAMSAATSKAFAGFAERVARQAKHD